MKRQLFSSLSSLMLLCSVSSQAVLHFASDITIYETAPTGTLADSGWQFQGQFDVTETDGYLGTPIAPHHFITAAHLPDAAVGDSFFYRGQEYTTIGYQSQSGTDLRLWEIDGTFESYAPLYTATDEVGKPLVVFGRGVDRGDLVTNVIQVQIGKDKGQPVYDSVTVTNGWKWGSYSYTQRWGENAVYDIIGSTDQQFLRAYWDKDGGEHEAMLTDKDSGGAVFILEGGIWKLAGINYGIGPSVKYSQDPSGTPSFPAAILDFRGDLYSDTGVDYADTQESYFYSSRISSSFDWITNNIADFDSDLDRLPDWWEATYSQTEADADPDADGFTNVEEWMADTDPNSSNSLPSILEWQAPTNVIFASSASRMYLIESRDALDAGDWATEVDWFGGADGQTEQAVAGLSSNRFYRIRVKVR